MMYETDHLDSKRDNVFIYILVCLIFKTLVSSSNKHLKYICENDLNQFSFQYSCGSVPT